MPKVLLGCLGVVFVLAVAGALTAYFLVVKPAYEFASDVSRFGSEYQALNERLDPGHDFQAPADGEISAEQFQRFLVAQRTMRSGLQEQLDELQQKWRELDEERQGRDRDLSILELVSAYRDLGDLLLEAKRQQVTALNRYNFSVREYYWVRNQVYQALGEEISVVSFGEQGLAARPVRLSAEMREMINAHREEIMEGYALAWFGL